MLNKKNLIIFLIIIIIVIAGLEAYVLLQKTSQTLPPGSIPQPSIPPVVTQPKIKYTYQNDLPKLQESLEVFSVAKAIELNETKASELANGFGFNQTPQILDDVSGKVYSFQKDQQSLIIYPKPIRLDYYNGQKPTSKRLNKDQLKSSANNFVGNLKFIGKSFTMSESYFRSVKTESGQEGFLDAPLNEAKFIDIRYNLKIRNVSIISKDRQSYPVQLLLNPDGSIQSTTITLIPDQISSLGSTRLAKPVEALNAINNGMGIVSYLDNSKESYAPADPNSISQANLTSVELVYLYDYDNATLQPYYRFSGTSQTTSGENLNIEVLITALPQDVYKK